MANCDEPFTKPSVFKALIPSPLESVCAQFKKFINFIDTFYTWYSEMFDEDGCATQKLIDAVGGSSSGGTTTTGTTTTGTTTAAPVGGQQIWSTPGSNSFVVPAGVTNITMKLWGAGAGGGDGHQPPSAPIGTTKGSGGGGGGGGYTTQLLAVIAGETLTIIVPSGGAGGTLSGFSKLPGSNGGDAQVKRGAAILLDATGGSGGGAGYQICGGTFIGGSGGSGGVGVTATGANGVAATSDPACLAVSAGAGGVGADSGFGNGGNGGPDGSNGLAGSNGRAQFNW